MPNSPFKLTMIAGAVSAAFAPNLYAATAGKVDFATPGVNVVGPNGQSRPAAKGTELQTGETIDTGGGRAQLRFTDGGMVSLQPQTQFRIESYGYDKDDSNKNSVVMNLLKGGLRTITGLIGKTNRQGYKLQTTTATVGIRGTEFSVASLPNGTLLFNCTDGSIDVTNQAGSTTLAAGQTAVITSQSSTPTKTDDKPFLPPTAATATQIPPPQNPVQDAGAAVPTILTGTFTGQWRTASNQTGFQSPGYGTGVTPTFTVGSNGLLTSFSSAFSDSYGNTVTYGSTLTGGGFSDGNDGVMAWGRWVGTTSPIGSSGNPTFTAADPLHYVVGVPVAVLPTSGTGTYTMYGATTPTCSGSCGVLGLSGAITVNFGSYTGSYAMNLSNSADGARLSTGGSLSFDPSGINFSGGGSAYGTSTAGAVSGGSQIDGFLAGTTATHAGAIYNISYGPQGYGTSVTGAAVFKR